MTSRYGSVLTLKVPRKVAQVVTAPAQVVNAQVVTAPATQERAHRPAVSAQRFGRYKALAGGLRSALRDAAESCEDLPTDRNGNC